MKNTVISVLAFVSFSLFSGMCFSDTLGDNPVRNRANNLVVASIGDNTITLKDVDTAGGRSVYDAQHKLYEERVRSMYGILAKQVLTIEANEYNLTAEQLLDREVNQKTGKISDADVENFLAKQGKLTNATPKMRGQARLYLAMQHRSVLRQKLIGDLFKKHDVRVTLIPPPSPPAEIVKGPTTPSIGNENAPITMVVFSDFQCPYCKAFHNTINKIMTEYPDKLRVIYRHLPLTGHTEAQKLAEASMCANDQGKFTEYANMIFDTNNVKASMAVELAKKLDLNVEKFRDCFTSAKHASRIRADMQEAQRLQIGGTPASFINGVRHGGAIPHKKLVGILEEILLQHRAIAKSKNVPSDDDS